MTEPPFDIQKAHRWFAIEQNNRAWDLIEKNDRSEAETKEALQAAHVASYHWHQIGEAIHRARAITLVAWAQGINLHWEAARQSCEDAKRWIEECQSEEFGTFDQAILSLVYSRVLNELGESDLAENFRREAQEISSDFQGAEKEVFSTLVETIEA